MRDFLTAEDVKRIERAMAKFNTCDSAGSFLAVEVDRKAGTKSFRGYCNHENRRIDVEPTCRICLRHTKIKKKTKKTAVKIQRIKQGRQRQKQRKERVQRFTIKS